jgi:hypothetical protein
MQELQLQQGRYDILPECPRDLSVGKENFVKDARTAISEQTADKMLRACPDLLGNIDNRVSQEQMRTMALMVFQAPSHATSKVRGLTLLMRAQFIATFNLSMQVARRGEELRHQKLVFRFNRVIEAIGPSGTETTMMLSNKGKMNKTGRRKYLAAGPHLNALRDSSAFLGLCWLV